MAARSAALRQPTSTSYSPSIGKRATGGDDPAASTSGRGVPSWHSESRQKPAFRVSSALKERYLAGRIGSPMCVAQIGRRGRCRCRHPLRAGPLSAQRRELLAWCIAALVGGPLGAACAEDSSCQGGVWASATLGRQRGLEVNVMPLWSKVEAGPILEDGGFPPTVVAAPGRRVVATGDFHGDLRAARRALELAGVMTPNKPDCWVGGSTVFVQVGDILDRGDDEIAIMSLLAHLSRQASAAGGALYQVCGNHETMNVYGDFRYVTPGAFKEGDWFDRWAQERYNGDHMAAFQNWYKEAPTVKEKYGHSASASWNPLLANRLRKVRQQLFEPGGALAKVMARYSTVLQVNDSLFAHGGVLPHHVEYGLARLNREVSQWMLGHKDRRTGELQEQPFVATRGFNSVMWSRLYSREEYETGMQREQACMTLSKALRMVPDARRLIVGHTPQETGANSECNGRIWRIDVGMSSGILEAAPEVLEISDNEVRILSADRADDLWVASYL